MKKTLNIGLLGLNPIHPNKGCEALTYSFLNLLATISKKNSISFNVHFIFLNHFKDKILLRKKTYFDAKQLQTMFPSMKFIDCYAKYYHHHYIVFPKLGKLFAVFDFTEGDSFSDIYGKERFFSRSMIKLYFEEKNIPLIIGSQTIGPFYDDDVRNLAIKIIDGSHSIIARDIESFEYVKKIAHKNPKLTSDLAFLLPYDAGNVKERTIGINVSGLLWNINSIKNCKIKLAFCYRDYCRGLISKLIKSGYKVCLIGHVISNDLRQLDNDKNAINELHLEFPETIVAPDFKTPMEAKNFISQMISFSGARMHATIASLSAGVPVLPFSYSRKFEGLFGSLGYQNIIHGTVDSLEIAIEKSLAFLTHPEKYIDDMNLALSKIDVNNKEILNIYNEIFVSLMKI